MHAQTEPLEEPAWRAKYQASMMRVGSSARRPTRIVPGAERSSMSQGRDGRNLLFVRDTLRLKFEADEMA